ncbi:hypothetical protein HYV69_02270 [Candidatus Uhrbacteria bacterium]|nr:hypothetical protein [Candidatus Uhrbacteria bacterium]
MSNFQSTISHTGFYVSLISYVVFWILDILKPGFVARVFSVHIFLLSAIAFGIWWAIMVKEYTERPWFEMIIALVMGILLSVLVWIFGEGFGMFRFLVVIIAFFTPLLFLRLVCPQSSQK